MADVGLAVNAPATLRSWELFCAFGAANVLRIGDVTYSWDTRPREQKNGSLVGRVYAQARGEVPKDCGSYKILADGSVSELPAPLAAVLVAPKSRLDPETCWPFSGVEAA